MMMIKGTFLEPILHASHIAKVKSHATGFTFILPFNLNKVEYYCYPNFIDE